MARTTTLWLTRIRADSRPGGSRFWATRVEMPMHIAPAGTIAEAAAATTTSPVAQSGSAPWARVSSTPSPFPPIRTATPVSPTMIGIISAT